MALLFCALLNFATKDHNRDVCVSHLVDVSDDEYLRLRLPQPVPEYISDNPNTSQTCFQDDRDKSSISRTIDRHRIRLRIGGKLGTSHIQYNTLLPGGAPKKKTKRNISEYLSNNNLQKAPKSSPTFVRWAAAGHLSAVTKLRVNGTWLQRVALKYFTQRQKS